MPMHFRRYLPGAIAALVAALFVLAHLLAILLIHNQTALSVFLDFFTPVTDVVAVVMMLLVAWKLRGVYRQMGLVWGILAFGLLFKFGGDTLCLVYKVYPGQSPTPSPVDIVYLLYYPVFIIGVLLIPSRKESPHEWMKSTIDIVIIMLAALLLSWNLIIGPTIQAGAENQLILYLSLAYPVGDLLMIWALLTILYRPFGTRHSLPLWLLFAGGAAIVGNNFLYGYQQAHGTYQSGSLVEVIYTLGNMLFALAGVAQLLQIAEHHKPGFQAEAPRPAVPGSPDARSWWVYTPYIGVACAYFLLVSGTALNLPTTITQLSLIVGAIITLIVLRQVVTMRENRVLSADLQVAMAELKRQATMLEQANQEMQGEILERRRAEERLSYDALHDSLTGLPNRVLFLDRLGQAGRKKKRNPDFQYAVLFLDLDSFKVVNDSLGHMAGDQLLIRTAKILINCVRMTDTVARLGGDEFIILLEDVNTADDVTHTAERLQSELNHPVQLSETQVFVTGSIGVVENVEEYECPEDILRDADLAMYQAKSRGKDCYEIFHAGMRANAIMRMELESDLRRAIENKEFVLHYQPILELPNQKIIGFEALVRWQHPRRGLVPPGEFIPIAEETGLILPLGKWILNEACRQAYEWQAKFGKTFPFKVSVNISGKQLKQSDFVAMVAQALGNSQLPANCLALEVTESVCLDSLEAVAGTLTALQKLGVETQIDDFGTGYSSLSYLQRLPVHSIKIDRSFIRGISDGNRNAPDIIRAIFSLVDDLGIKAVAEGIENEAQLAELNRMHCSYVQGFLLAMPMDKLNLEKWMRSTRPSQTGQLIPGKANIGL
jgi:diguanylate cyclase (GGDEF)-like protein